MATREFLRVLGASGLLAACGPSVFAQPDCEIWYAKARRLPILHTGDLVDYLSDANCNIARRDLEGRTAGHALRLQAARRRFPEEWHEFDPLRWSVAKP